MTGDKEKYALSALTSVCIKQVNFSEKKMKFSLGQTKLSVIYIVRYILSGCQ